MITQSHIHHIFISIEALKRTNLVRRFKRNSMHSSNSASSAFIVKLQGCQPRKHLLQHSGMRMVIIQTPSAQSHALTNYLLSLNSFFITTQSGCKKASLQSFKTDMRSIKQILMANKFVYISCFIISVKCCLSCSA